MPKTMLERVVSVLPKDKARTFEVLEISGWFFSDKACDTSIGSSVPIISDLYRSSLPRNGIHLIWRSSISVAR